MGSPLSGNSKSLLGLRIEQAIPDQQLRSLRLRKLRSARCGGEGTRPSVSSRNSNDALRGAALTAEADFLIFAVLAFCILDRSLARIPTRGDRHLAQVMIVVPLDPPLARVHPILKDHGWLRHDMRPPILLLLGKRTAHAGNVERQPGHSEPEEDR
jgi:hypothetical protein